MSVAMEALIYLELFSDWLVFYEWEGYLQLICFFLRVSPGAMVGAGGGGGGNNYLEMIFPL